MGFYKNIIEQIRASRELQKKFQRALAYSGPQKKQIITILSLTLVVAGVGVIEPLVMKFIFDSLAGENLFRDLALGVAMLSLIILMRESLSGVSNYFTWRSRLRIHYGLLGATVGRLHNLPLDFHRKHGVGAVMTKLERGISGFVSTITELSFNVIPAIFYLFLAIIFMANLDWRLTILVLIFTPVPGIIAAYAAPYQRTRERTLMDTWAKIYSRFNEVLSGIMTVKSFAMERRADH